MTPRAPMTHRSSLMESVSHQLHSWKPFQLHQTLTAEGHPSKPYLFPTKKPCRSDRSTAPPAIPDPPIDLSRLSLRDENNLLSRPRDDPLFVQGFKLKFELKFSISGSTWSWNTFSYTMLPRYFNLGPVSVSGAYRIRIRTRYAPDTAPIRQLAYQSTWRIVPSSIRYRIRVLKSDTDGIRQELEGYGLFSLSLDCPVKNWKTRLALSLAFSPLPPRLNLKSRLFSSRRHHLLSAPPSPLVATALNPRVPPSALNTFSSPLGATISSPLGILLSSLAFLPPSPLVATARPCQT